MDLALTSIFDVREGHSRHPGDGALPCNIFVHLTSNKGTEMQEEKLSLVLEGHKAGELQHSEYSEKKI